MKRQPDWKRSWWCLAAMLAVWGYCWAIGPIAVDAQEAKGKAAAPVPAAAPPAAAPTSEPEAAPAPSKSVLVWLIETSGWIGAVLLVLSIYFVAKIVHLYYDMRMEVAAPPKSSSSARRCSKPKTSWESTSW